MKFQNRSCTSSGVPRKNQMYAQLPPETSGFGDRRITARITPRTIPMAIAMTVSSIVTSRPCRTRLEKKKSPTTSQPKRELVAADRVRTTARKTTTTAATQRPGWRTGTARISSGRPVAVSFSVAPSATDGQLMAALTFGFLIPPSVMPHFLMIWS